MAFPSVVGTPSETSFTPDTDPWTVNRPAGVSGQLTIAIVGQDGASTRIWPAGYTEFLTEPRSTAFLSAAAYHWEDGTEGTTFSLDLSAGEKGAAIVYSISGAENPSTQAPEAAGFDAAATLNPDPPELIPTGGAKDYLWITGFTQDGEEVDDDTWCTAAPTNYSNLLQKTSDIAGATTTNASLATAQRQLNAASENPGTFTVVQSLTYAAFTIAIHPAAAVASISFDVGQIPVGF